MFAETGTIAFVTLLADEVEAHGLAGLLQSLVLPPAAGRARFPVPDVRGRNFFADAAAQPSLDRWWGRQVVRGATPVYLLADEPGLAPWLRGLDGLFLVAGEEVATGDYPGCTVVPASRGQTALALAEAVIRRFSEPSVVSADAVFALRDAAMVASVREEQRPTPQLPPRLPSLLDVDSAGAYTGVGHDERADPLDLLVAESTAAERRSPIWEVPAARRAAGGTVRPRRMPRLHLRPARARPASPSDDVLAARIVERAPMLVVIGSRKGGVGKTSHAAGMAIIAGEVLDRVGHLAAIVDANIANPDAWGLLQLPAGAATVRDVVLALNAGREPPPAVHAATPALACFPESREGAEYGRVDVRRLAAHLRSRHAFTVVDMSNRLPDPTAGPEAAVAAYWLDEADALVLPTACSRQDFNGVLDYLDVADLPPTVVPCIVPSSRRTRDHPATRHYLGVIGARVDRLVEIPDEADSVRLAGMSGAAVQDVSPRMGAAYRRLTDAVVRLPPRRRR